MATTPNLIPTLLVGIGGMGKKHFTKLAGSTQFDLLGVVDPIFAREGVAASNGIPEAKCFATIESFLKAHPSCRAAVIACSTEHHHSVATKLLRNGLDILVEKPIASSANEAAEILDLAKAFKRKVHVGHIERFNPCWQKFQNILKENAAAWGSLQKVQIKRHGKMPQQIKPGNDVILDLAIHDFDLIAAMFQETKLSSVHLGSKAHAKICEDALLHLACDYSNQNSRKQIVPIELSASWWADAPNRAWTLVFDHSKIVIDLANRRIHINNHLGDHVIDAQIPNYDMLEAQYQSWFGALIDDQFFTNQHQHKLCDAATGCRHVVLAQQALAMGTVQSI